jgi:methionine biosynthesis protein MetW
MRDDIEQIVKLIPSKSRVLDIGCGEGELLAAVKAKGCDARGLELDQLKVAICLQNGLSVMQGDADIDLAHYPDNAFDYAVLTNTLQVTKHPEKILVEMLRIAKYLVVSIPNFGYWRNRWQLVLSGRMPVTKKLSYQWYETPNIHFCTIRDFIILCEGLNIKIEKRLAINPSGKVIHFTGLGGVANIFGEQGVFLLSK